MLNLMKSAYIKLSRALPRGYALPPINLTMELTYRCNLDCRTCYLNRTGARDSINKTRELSLDEIKNILNTLIFKIPFTKKKIPHLLFTGGEIFLRDDIMDILAFASQKAGVSVLTNGTLLSEDIIKALVDMGVELVMFSVDGPREVHDIARNKKGSFDTVIANIEKMTRLKRIKGKRKPTVQINTVISEINAEALPRLIPLAKDIGVDELVFASEDLSTCRWLGAIDIDEKEYLKKPPEMKFGKLVSLKKNIEEIYKEAEKKKGLVITLIAYETPQEVIKYHTNELNIGDYSCHYPWTTMRISAYGDIFPCYRLKIGNVRKITLRELKNMWNCSAYRHFRQSLKREGLFPGCVGCSRGIIRGKLK